MSLADEFKKLPAKVRASVCSYSCEHPKYVSYASYENYVGSLGPEYPYGFICTTCKKPYIYSIWDVLERKKRNG